MKRKSYLLVIAAAILWGTTGTSQALAGSNPLILGALRMLIGGTLMMGTALLRKSFNIKHFDKQVLLAALAMAAYQPMFFTAVKLTGVALGTMLAIASAPIFSGILRFIKYKSIDKTWLIATCISLPGSVLLFSDPLKVHGLGLVLAFGAGLAYACYVHVTEKLLSNNDVFGVNGCIFFVSGLVLSPLLIFGDISVSMEVSVLIAIIHLGVFATALAYSLFAIGLRHMSSPEAVTLTLFEPLTAALLGVLVLKEEVNLLMIMGMVMIFIGLVFMALSKGKDVMALDKPSEHAS